MTYCIGLTGGIGSGKSSAARLFASLGAAIVDVDDISHTLTKPGGAAIPLIREQFGEAFITADSNMDRKRMREHVFGNAAAKAKLEAILHPAINQAAREQVALATQPYLMLVVPLLLERDGYRDLIQRVVVVDCTEQQQIERTMSRSAISAAAVRAIMATQLPRAKRLARADDVLHNGLSEDHLRQQVATLHQRYLDLAQEYALTGRKSD